MQKHYNIILANAPINNGNRGCVALSITAIAIIDRILTEANIDYDFFLPDSLWSDCVKKTYISDDFTIKYTPCRYYKTINRNENIKLRINHFLGRCNYKEIFQKADFILDIGEGDSFSDIYGEKRFNLIDRIHIIANELHKPYCILPQTVGPFKNKAIEKKAIKSINQATLCMVRDKQSYDYVCAIAPQQKSTKEYIDIVFFMPYKKIIFEKGYIHVGLNISALLWNGGYTANNQFGLKDDYKKVIESIIIFFLAQPNIKLHLIAHVVGQERNVENDYAVCYDLWREYNDSRIVLAPFALGPIEIKSYISGMDFFIGARMHSTIGAFSSGIPVVPMAYSRKFNGLFEDTLDYHYMTDLKTQTKDEILSTIKDAFDKRLELKKIIRSRMDTVVKEREELLYDELRKFFKLA